MKKKILGGFAVLAIAVTMALNVNLNANNNDISDISLSNVEALVYGETVIIGCCPGGGICIVNGLTILGYHPCSVSS